MNFACSPTWFLIVTLLAWALLAFLALVGGPYALSTAPVERRTPARPAKVARKAPRALIQRRKPVRAVDLSPDHPKGEDEAGSRS